MASRMIRKFAVPLLFLALVVIAWPTAAVHAAVYSFNVGEPPSVSAAEDGDTVRITGAGTFDTVKRKVRADGALTVRDPSGQTVFRGTYGDAKFVSFEALGGPIKGIQGGILDITVTIFGNDGEVIPDVPMEIVCPFENGVFDEGDDGTTLGPFTTPVSGITVFHLIKP